MCRVCKAAEREAARGEAMQATILPDGSRYYEDEGDEHGAPHSLKRMLAGFDLTPHEVAVLYKASQAAAQSALWANHVVGVPGDMILSGQWINGLAMGMHLREVTMSNPPEDDDPSVPDDMKGQ